MKIRLIVDADVEERHGLTKGLEIYAEPWPSRKKGQAWWSVTAPGSDEKVGILRLEAVVVK